MLSFFSAQGYAGSCPDGSEPVKSVSVDGSYFIYECDEIINDDDLIQYNFNEAIGGPFCNEPNGFCASWKSNASKECKDNYRFGGNYSSTQERLNYETCIEQISLKPFIGTKYGTYFEINCSKSSNNTSMNNKNPTLDYNIKLLDNCKRDVEGNWTNDITRAKYMYVVGENGNCDYGLGNTEKGALNDCLRIKEKHNLVGSCVLYGKDGKVVMKGYSDLSWDMGDEGGSSSVDNNLTAKQNISGFEFINEAYTKMVEKNGVLEQSPLDTEITGWYARLPVDNDWHVGKIFYEKGQLKWKNLAGVEWSLQPDIDNNKLITGEDNPYQKDYQPDFMLIYLNIELAEVGFAGSCPDGSEPVKSVFAVNRSSNASPTINEKANADRLIKAGWDKPTLVQPKIIAASDVPKVIKDAVKEGLNASIERLGNYGPLKIYIIGNDDSIIEPIIKDFCNWSKNKYSSRVYSNSDDFKRCSDDQGEAMREMAYIFPGGNGFADHGWNLRKPTQTFVHNPLAGDSNEFLALKYDNELQYDKVGTAHEYFHVYQNAHIVFREGGDRSSVYALPRWIEESHAVYFSWVLGNENGWIDINDRIAETVQEVSSFRDRVPGMTIIDIESEFGTKRVTDYCGELCIGQLQYSYALIATILLAQKTSDDALFLDFYKQHKNIGWVAAFEKVFGISVDEFYLTLEDFLSMPIYKQIEQLRV